MSSKKRNQTQQNRRSILSATPFPDRPWTVCFYSYRGGVGRTTALLNTAISLNDNFTDANVFLLDFDLEAPGIDEFQRFQPPISDQPGLVEYVAAYQESGNPPPLEKFVYQGPKGIWIMRAGRKDDDYVRQLARLDWSHLYRFEDGQRLFENLRAGVQAEFGCNFMLVDCRTGLTDIGGVCLGHLADAVALVFQPTRAQSVGLRHVVRAIRERTRREMRFFPRVYVGSKVRETHEGVFDPDELEEFKAIIATCEDSNALHDLSEELCDSEYVDLAELAERINAIEPSSEIVKLRESVAKRNVPDSYLDNWTPTSPAVRNFNLAVWCIGTRAATKELIDLPSAYLAELSRIASDIRISKMASLKARLLEPEFVECLKMLNSEFFDQFSPAKQAIILKAIRSASRDQPKNNEPS